MLMLMLGPCVGGMGMESCKAGSSEGSKFVVLVAFVPGKNESLVEL